MTTFQFGNIDVTKINPRHAALNGLMEEIAEGGDVFAAAIEAKSACPAMAGQVDAVVYMLTAHIPCAGSSSGSAPGDDRVAVALRDEWIRHLHS